MTTAYVIDKLVAEFDAFPDWEMRYAHIISLGKLLAPYPEEFRTDEYKVKGCQSQVWLYARRHGDTGHGDTGRGDTGRGDTITFYADSDAVIVRGLLGLIMRIFNERTPEEILAVPNDFTTRLGLDQHLSVNRANGLASVVKQMKMYALVLRKIENPIIRETEIENPIIRETEIENPKIGAVEKTAIRERVIEQLKTVFDPEIPIDIYELGLIYEVGVDDEANVHVLMTLTTPNCPSAQTLPGDVDKAAKSAEGVKSVVVEITFDPPWDKTMMSEAALFSMGLF